MAVLKERDAGQAQGLAEIVLGAMLLGLAAKYIALISAGNAALGVSLNWISGDSDLSLSVGAGLWLITISGVVAVVVGLRRLGRD